jgi:hypothetical protein
LDTIALSEAGPDRIAITGVQGMPPPPDLKVAVNFVGGYRNEVTLGIVGLGVEQKAALVEEALVSAMGDSTPAELHFELVRSGTQDPDTNAEAASMLSVSARDVNPDKVGRPFSDAVIGLALANYPGFFALAPPTGASAYGVYWPALVPRSVIRHEAVLEDGTRVLITEPRTSEVHETTSAPDAWPLPCSGSTIRAALGTVVGARSGDKGGNANVGVWVRSDAQYRWLVAFLTVDRLQLLLPEAAPLDIERYEFPNIRGINFVLKGLLGEGVASSTRFDPQAKSLGEWLRSRLVEIPSEVLVP